MCHLFERGQEVGVEDFNFELAGICPAMICAAGFGHRAAQRAQRKLAVTGVNTQVKALIDMTHVGTLIKSYDTVLKADGYHIMLLQTRQPLAAGDKFTCAIDFQKAGTIETEVNVRSLP